MSQHTPEPWTDRIGRVSARGEWTLLCGCRIVSGTETTNEGVCPDEVWIGQCPIHAAAPELLAALRAILKITDGTQPKDYPAALMVARAAIATATEEG